MQVNEKSWAISHTQTKGIVIKPPTKRMSFEKEFSKTLLQVMWVICDLLQVIFQNVNWKGAKLEGRRSSVILREQDNFRQLV